MRKWTSLLLVFTLLSALPALAQPGLLFSEPILEERLWVQGLARTRQGLLVLTMEEGLYLWERDGRPPQKALPQGQPERLDMLVGDGHRAWLVNTYQGRAYPWQPQGLTEEPLLLDFSGLHNPSGFLLPEYAPQTACAVGDRLYWLTESAGLFAFDLKDGSRKEHPIPHLKWIAPGPKGSLLALSFEGKWNAEQLAFDPPHLARLTPETSRWEGLGALPVSLDIDRPFVPFVYEDAAQHLVYAKDAGLYRWPLQGGDPVLFAHLPDSVQAGGGRCPTPLALLSGGMSALVTASGILVSDSAEEAPPLLPLTLADTNGRLYFEGTAARRAALQLTHLQVKKQPLFRDQEDFSLKLITGTELPDMFLLDTSQDDLASLIDKGYLMDLSQSQALPGLLPQMLPAIQRAVTRQGALYALPIQLSFGTWVTRDNALHEAGLAPPREFFSYCDLLEKWYGGLMDEFPLWTPQTGTQDPLGDVLRLGYELYIQHIRGSGQSLTFDTTLFRRMMERGMAVMPDGEIQEGTETESLFRGGSSRALLDIISTRSVYVPQMEHVVMPEQPIAEFTVQPAADAGLDPTPRGVLTVLAVNPRSPNREHALQYLEAYARHLEWQDGLLLGLEEARDIPNPDYDRTISLLEQEAQRLTQVLEGLSGAEKRKAEDKFQRHLNWLETSRQTQRLLLTREEAALAQAKAGMAYIRDAGQSPEFHPAMVELFERFATGGLSLDMYIQEADQRLRLIAQENW